MTYRYVAGIDYGPRDGTLGLSFHMSEGGDGLPLYLARHSGEDLHQWAGRVNGDRCDRALVRINPDGDHSVPFRRSPATAGARTTSRHHGRAWQP